MNAHLKANDIAMQHGTIINPTLIAVSSTTKNEKAERDPEMHKTKKGYQWHHRCTEGCSYGMNVHLDVNNDTGLIHSVETTAANVHSRTSAAKLLQVEEIVVFAYAGYQGIGK